MKLRAADGDVSAAGKLERYGFLDDLVPKHRVHGVRRAEGTFASASDAH
ncbi:hypothetical protein GCM10025789_07820 [Tessaracoccus lubricantis]|uniref:Uncharacterized protein n=1 Tax=Tessaracoccus lubricantis TaxID=545543 RepID=A0ABP9F478_9ACTN